MLASLQFNKYLLIAGLYLAQGLPGGLMAITLPTLLREQGASLKLISLVSLISFPWALKLLWSRPLDQSPNRRNWFIASFLTSAVLWLCLSILDLSSWLRDVGVVFFALLLITNFIMASQDVLTDGLVIRLLNVEDRGIANSLQVVSYKFGMLISGSLLLGFYDQIGWQRSMQCLVLVLFLSYLPFLILSRLAHYQTHLRQSVQHGASAIEAESFELDGLASSAKTNSKATLIPILKKFISLPGMLYWIAILACYKLGDGMISSLTKPFWFDMGVTKELIAQASGVGIGLGLLAGIAAGLLWKKSMLKGIEPRFIILVFALLQCTSILGYYFLSITEFDVTLWWVLVLFEAIVDVMSTVIIFTSMMSMCRKVTAGIDYTFQATILLICSQSLHPISGFLADSFGYATVFLLAFVMTIPVMLLLLNKKMFHQLTG